MDLKYNIILFKKKVAKKPIEKLDLSFKLQL